MSFEISPRQLDLLDAAFLQRPEAAAAWQRWSGEVDWDGHLDFTSFALLPRAYRNLRKLGFDDPIFPRCKGILHQAWLANQRLIAALGPGLEALARGSVEPVLLPPSWLLTRDRGAVIDRGHPLCWALDPAQAEPAVRALLAAGWRLEGARVPDWSLCGYIAGINHLQLRAPDGPPWLLAWGLIHWQGWPSARAAAESFDFGGRQVRALAAGDALGYLLWQPGQRDGYALAVQLLTVASVSEVGYWPEHLAASASPLPEEWDAWVEQIAHLLAQWGAPPGFGHVSVDAQPATPVPRAYPWQRLRRDWERYRRALGEAGAGAGPLRQLPGYLMGRWRLRRLRQLPRGAMCWLLSGRRKKQPEGSQTALG